MIRTRLYLTALLALLATSGSEAITDELIHVRLKDRLDRPADGYCLDIMGTGSNLLLDVPLFAHNCKNGPTPDSTVIFTNEGQLVFPAARVCVTAFGVNSTVLPGTPILLRPCNSRTPFFDTSNLQQFSYLDNGQLQLRSHKLCLAVGQHSAHTYSPTDRWRVLSLEPCNNIESSYSSWEMVKL